MDDLNFNICITTMNNTFYTLILFTISNLFAQENYTKLPSAKTQSPTFIFNEYIIGSEALLNSLVTSEKELKNVVKELSVLKGKPEKGRDDYYNLSEFGILFEDLKKKITSKSQSEINRFFGINPQNEIYVDGYLVEYKEYKIALASIIEIEFIEPEPSSKLEKRVLNIWTLNKNERYVKTDRK